MFYTCTGIFLEVQLDVLHLNYRYVCLYTCIVCYKYIEDPTYNLKYSHDTVLLLSIGVQYGPVQYGLVTMNSPGLTYRQACTYYPVTCDVARVVQWLNEMRFV